MSLRNILAILLIAFVFLPSCDDLLTVEDPQSYADEDLDREEAIPAVANGVLGDFYMAIDDFVLVTALLADEYQHTGTWNDWDQISTGKIEPGIPNGSSDGAFDDLLSVRWAAEDAVERIEDVLGAEAESNEYYVQVKVVKAFANLITAMGYAEAPREAGGEAIRDTQLAELTITQLSEAIQLAQSAGFTNWERLATAGRARAQLMAGNHSEALTDAQSIPNGFVHNAMFSVSTGGQQNSIVSLTHWDHNRAGGLYNAWWDQVDADEGYLIDPNTDELDPRVPIRYEDGALGVDGNTPHYSEMKYTNLGDDIRLTHWQEMRLIEAEVYFKDEKYQDALDKINEVRDAAGLTEHTMPSDQSEILDYILYERFAEMFLEGHRLNDLNRYNLIREVLGPGRAVKLPISTNEVNANSNISFPRDVPETS